MSTPTVELSLLCSQNLKNRLFLRVTALLKYPILVNNQPRMMVMCYETWQYLW